MSNVKRGAEDNTSGELERLDALKAALGSLPHGVGLFHLDGRPIYLNQAFVELYAIGERPMGRNRTFDDMIESGAFDGWKTDARTHFRNLREALENGRDFSAEIDLGDRIVAVHDRRIDGKYILSTQQDVTSRVLAERRVLHLAQHDPLTELPNRACFTARLDDVVEQARVKGQKFGMISIDVDRFKDVNDIFGHSAGDALLQELARRFRDCAADSFVARLGGDEFIVLSFGGHQPQASGAFAGRIMDATTGTFDFGDHTLTVSLSIGIAIYPDDGEDATALLSNADAALYRAKSDGRGAIRFFEPAMDQRIHEQRRLNQDLKVALAKDEFELRYQPQATVGREIFGFEALLRWRHPRRGLVSPDEFVSVAEESGLIIEIGEWVLRSACREAVSWPRPLSIAVNLSPVQFRHGDLPALVHSILMETGLSPGRLELEITEGVLMHDFARAMSQLRRLKNLGVHVAMDDFGTGYSSLSYLQAFPFDTLKMDKSFIAKLQKNEHANEIVRAVIGLGRGLNLPIVAEGVETQEQLDFLAREQCQNIQGYLVGRPLPIEDYAHILGHAGGNRSGNVRAG